MTSDSLYPVTEEWARKARVDAEGYAKLYGRSLADPGSFWLEQAKRLDWVKRPEIAGDWSFDEEDFHISWFADGKLNVAANCVDRHLASRGNAVAILWEPDDPSEAPRRYTYLQLYEEVCRFANVLKAEGVQKGDRVTIYMPIAARPKPAHQSNATASHGQRICEKSEPMLMPMLCAIKDDGESH